MTDPQAALEVRDIHKRFGNLEVIRGVSLRASAGDVVATGARCYFWLHR